MRKIVVYTITSIDGAVDDPTRLFPPDVDPDRPQPPTFDDELIARETELIERQDAVLLGRHMYDEWSRYWPISDVQPFADFINGARKYVVTSTPLTTQWGDAEAVSGPLPDIVRDLKALPGKDIGVHGSITLAQSLLAEGLVDELHLAVAPLVDPEGRRLFERAKDLQRLTLHTATPTPGGALWLVYRPLRSG
ncbi:RibD domain-containing protein [Humibacillus xanthopallidus]|uniref:RibD domain-containing protein n=1 Tax=Humibacillus xanthopallidus TaxID=412689 RepID=A0A543PNI3_9MICO|nr:dihydrofolate reductase family protein [Humibacillus xanthopallidus]TQN45632.1 RibD domain-containing protein [Humibacillus xanthopallidus]